MGDFNGDGYPDLVMLSQPMSYGGRTFYTDISILLGNGDGSLRPPVTFPVVSAPETLQSIAAADFNGDGRLDLAVSATGFGPSSGRVMLLLSNADGSFQRSSSFSSIGGSIRVADFNGDGRTDVLEWSDFGLPGSVRLSVLLGNGDGTLRPPVDTTISGFGQSASFSFVARDFNGDGRTDLVFAASSPARVVMLLTNDDGTFRPPADILTGSAAAILAAGDFNGDGKLDILLERFSGTGGELAVLLGNGDGTFQDAVSTPFEGTSFLNALAAVDFDHDGSLDLVALGYAPDSVAYLYTYLGNGDGTFRLQATTNAGYADGAAISRLTIADFNGDGIPDAAIDGYESVSILSGKDDGSFSGTPFVPADGHPSSVVIADFDSDGKADLAYLNESGVSFRKGNGDGSFQAGVKVGPSSPGADTREGALAGVLVVADLNGDGRLDLINVTSISVSTMLGTGGGSFQNPTVYRVGNDRSSGPAPVVGDFNGDGRPDLATVANGKIAILLGAGANGGFQMPPAYYDAGSSPTFLAVGDFNGDGKLDLVVTNDGVSILLGNGDGSFQAPVSITDPFDVEWVSPVSLAVCDMNGDGRPDIAVAFISSSPGGVPGGVLLLFGTGNAAFQPPVEVMLPGFLETMTATDLDGDGKVDLVIGNSGSVTILFGNGDGTFQAPVLYGAGDTIVSIAAGDVNGDGRPDIVTANNRTKDLSVLLNAGPLKAGSASAKSSNR